MISEDCGMRLHELPDRAAINAMPLRTRSSDPKVEESDELVAWTPRDLVSTAAGD